MPPTMASSRAPPPPPAAILEIELVDHLTAPALATGLEPLTERLRSMPPACRLMVDCRKMTGYEAGARALFVQWNQAHRDRIDRVAVVTDNRLWHMVVSAMSLASGQSMRAFADPKLARTWLEFGI
jgi:hypothetical protein